MCIHTTSTSFEMLTLSGSSLSDFETARRSSQVTSSSPHDRTGPVFTCKGCVSEHQRIYTSHMHKCLVHVQCTFNISEGVTICVQSCCVGICVQEHMRVVNYVYLSTFRCALGTSWFTSHSVQDTCMYRTCVCILVHAPVTKLPVSDSSLAVRSWMGPPGFSGMRAIMRLAIHSLMSFMSSC